MLLGGCRSFLLLVNTVKMFTPCEENRFPAFSTQTEKKKKTKPKTKQDSLIYKKPFVSIETICVFL